MGRSTVRTVKSTLSWIGMVTKTGGYNGCIQTSGGKAFWKMDDGIPR
jgi:hypothetical protein